MFNHELSSGHGNLKETEEAVKEQSTSPGKFSSPSGTLELDLQYFINLLLIHSLPNNTLSSAMPDSKEQPCGLLPLEWAYCAK